MKFGPRRSHCATWKVDKDLKGCYCISKTLKSLEQIAVEHGLLNGTRKPIVALATLLAAGSAAAEPAPAPWQIMHANRRARICVSAQHIVPVIFGVHCLSGPDVAITSDLCSTTRTRRRQLATARQNNTWLLALPSRSRSLGAHLYCPVHAHTGADRWPPHQEHCSFAWSLRSPESRNAVTHSWQNSDWGWLACVLSNAQPQLLPLAMGPACANWLTDSIQPVTSKHAYLCCAQRDSTFVYPLVVVWGRSSSIILSQCLKLCY